VEHIAATLGRFVFNCCLWVVLAGSLFFSSQFSCPVLIIARKYSDSHKYCFDDDVLATNAYKFQFGLLFVICPRNYWNLIDEFSNCFTFSIYSSLAQVLYNQNFLSGGLRLDHNVHSVCYKLCFLCWLLSAMNRL